MRFVRCLPLVASLAVASVGGAQVRAKNFLVSVRGGYLSFDRASSIHGAPMIGLNADYNFNEMFGLGVGLIATRPNTRGEDFITSLKYGDSVTYLFKVTQPLSVTDASINATLRAPAMRIQPYVSGGVDMRVTQRTGILLESRGLIYTDYKRSRLNPSRVGFADTRFVGDYPAPPKEKNTLRSITLTLGFSFIPSRNSVD